MASPVFHGLAGAGLALVLAGEQALPPFAFWRRSLRFLAAVVLLACLPDVDYVPGLLRGYLNTTHQQMTHSVAWVLLASAGIWLVGRAWRPALFGWRLLGFIVILAGSHLAVDLVTEDRLAPYGIPLWAPFSDRPVLAPVALLPAWDKTALADLGNWRNLRSLGLELAVGTAFLGGCWLAKRDWTRLRAAL